MAVTRNSDGTFTNTDTPGVKYASARAAVDATPGASDTAPDPTGGITPGGKVAYSGVGVAQGGANVSATGFDPLSGNGVQFGTDSQGNPLYTDQTAAKDTRGIFETIMGKAYNGSLHPSAGNGPNPLNGGVTVTTPGAPSGPVPGDHLGILPARAPGGPTGAATFSGIKGPGTTDVNGAPVGSPGFTPQVGGVPGSGQAPASAGAGNPNAYVVAGDPNYAANIGAQARALGLEEEQGMRSAGAEARDYGTVQGSGITAIGAGGQTAVNPYAQQAAALGNQGLADLKAVDATEGPSAAQAQLQMGSEASMGQALALARSGRNGTNPGAERQAMFQNAATMAQTSQQAAALRAQEDAARRQRQADELARGYTLAQQGQSVGGTLTNQATSTAASAASAGANVGLAGRNLNSNALAQGASERFAGENTAAQAAALGFNASSDAEHNKTTLYGIDKGIAVSDADRADRKTAGYLGAAIAGAGVLASDERGKTSIDPVSPDLRGAQGYSYEYKNPGAPGASPGRHVGPMAQDLEKSPATAGAVTTGPDGLKRVDTGRLALTNTSAIGEQQRRIDELAAQVEALGGRPANSQLDPHLLRRQAEALGGR